METTFDYDTDKDNILVTFKSMGTGCELTVAIPKETEDNGWIWDGTDDHGNRNPVGLNLVYSPPGFHYV